MWRRRRNAERSAVIRGSISAIRADRPEQVKKTMSTVNTRSGVIML
jgi:hypothetical protein